MTYDAEAGENVAGDQLGQGGGDDSKMVTVPADLLPNCKAGDTYKVVSMDDSGVKLEMVSGGDDGEDWAAGAKQAVSEGGMNE